MFKDSSANKGGFTSSSLEVLVGLGLADADHAQCMTIKEGSSPPDFYQAYIKEIQARASEIAALEFGCI